MPGKINSMKNKVVTLVATAVKEEDIPLIQGDVIGVDYGAFFCLQNKIDLIAAIGDFDSVDSTQFAMLQSSVKNLMKLNENKDQSDTELAIEMAIKLGYDKVIILGVIGSRIDHLYALLEVVKRFKHLHISIENKTNKISRLNQGSYQLSSKKKYFSVFAIEQSKISIKDAVYILNNHSLLPMDSLGLSNRTINGIIDVTVSSGTVLLFESEDA